MNDSAPAFVPQTLPPVIRSCDVADMAQVCQLYAREVLTGTASFEETAPSLDEMVARRASVLANGCPYLVAVRGAEVVGFAYAGPFHTRSAFRYTVENTVYVDPVAARAGVARALMAEVIARCTASGFRQMIAVIGGDNPASVAFHSAMGFRLVGRLEKVGFKFGRWLDTTTMQRSLGE
jgi:L-amino acid N-acyltransferase YncA